MLRKLLKHEFRATARIMLPLYAVVLLTATGANLSIRFGPDSSENPLVSLLSGFLLLSFVLALISVCIIAMVLMIQRFYKNLLGDEGYIMLTLPVSVHQHILSKLLVSTTWFAATALATALGILILFLDLHVASDLLDALRFLAGQLRQYGLLNAANITAIAAELAILSLVSGAVTCLQFYAAMAIGHSFSGRKILLSVVFYFGLQFAMQTVFTLAGTIPLTAFLTELAENISLNASGKYITAALHAAIGMSAIAMLLQGAVYYFLTAFMLKRRLNLE